MGRNMICDFECGMVTDAKQSGLSISETASLLGFPVKSDWSDYFELSGKQQ